VSGLNLPLPNAQYCVIYCVSEGLPGLTGPDYRPIEINKYARNIYSSFKLFILTIITICVDGCSVLVIGRTW